MWTRWVATADASGGDCRAPAPGWAARVILALIRGYQLLISPLFTGSCRFLPSCSAYASEAVQLHGPWRGTWLALRRLGRCHPLCAGGHDPVPPARQRSA